ncbi:hypothetical protein SUGI_0247200 [Cryptomeria japonica]|nr:hypothetical protein SUGI_0247200 [Cryptomeria japonica]
MFRVDKNADGRITEEEVKEVIIQSASAKKLSKIKEQAEEYATLIMEEIDPNNLGYIEVQSLEKLLLQCPGEAIKPGNWLFTWKFIQYKHRAVYHVMGYCVCTAKGAAETLKFNMALILLPVCRNTITWLCNKTKLGVAVAFDDNLDFHKVIATAVAIGVGLHAGAHLTCDFPRLLHATDAEYEPTKPFFGDERPPDYWWFVKGVEVHGIKLYLSHKWYKKTTWMYLAIPVLIYGAERIVRAFRSGYKSVKMIKVAIYPGNVLALQMSKPQGFEYKSGQYVFINCPVVSQFKWHPFSITSAPGDKYLSVHIRTLGDWTRTLQNVLSKVCETPMGGKSGLLRADLMQGEKNPRFPRLLIDGPYGAPAQDYKNYDVLLLVGLGIGDTPFISILKDIVDNMKHKNEEDDIENEGKQKEKSFNTSRAYFYWVTREQVSFEWFKGVMNEVAESNQKGIIELHNYCTSVYEEGDARSALIAILQALNHAKNRVDIVSGTRVKTHFAKPNWRKVFKGVALKHPNETVGKLLIKSAMCLARRVEIEIVAMPPVSSTVKSLIKLHDGKIWAEFGNKIKHILLLPAIANWMLMPLSSGEERQMS